MIFPRKSKRDSKAEVSRVSHTNIQVQGDLSAASKQGDERTVTACPKGLQVPQLPRKFQTATRSGSMSLPNDGGQIIKVFSAIT